MIRTLCFLLLTLVCNATVAASTLTWVGSAASPNWSSAANWNPAAVPQDGDSLVFPGTDYATTNDLQDLQVAGLSLTGPVTYIVGSRIQLSGTIDAGSGVFDLYIPVAITGTLLSHGNVVFRRQISGSATVTIDGSLNLSSDEAVPPDAFTGTFTSASHGSLYLMDTLMPAAHATASLAVVGSGVLSSIDTSDWLAPQTTIDVAVLNFDGTFQPRVGPLPSDMGILRSHGPVTLGPHAFLTYSYMFPFLAFHGREIVLLEIDGTAPVTGTFQNAPEGTEFDLAGTRYRLTYSGGDGNDIAFEWSGGIAPRMTHRARAVDFDGDGRGDLSLSSTSGSSAVWLMEGTTIRAGVERNAGPGYVLHAFGDFDGDGRTDIVWRHPDGSYRMTLMNGTVPASPDTTILDAGTGWEVIGTADLDGDGATDLVLGHPNGTYGAWLMHGASINQASVIAPPSAGFMIDALADFDGDGKTDVLWRDTSGSTILALMNGLGRRSMSTILQAPDWRVAFTPDLDGDGKADLVWLGPQKTWAAWTLDGVTPTGYSILRDGGTAWDVQGTGDLDGDGRDDLVWASPFFSGEIEAWLMNGTASRSRGTLLDGSGGLGWQVGAVRDLDGDGRDDIVVTNTTGTLGGWLMDGTRIKSGAMFFGFYTGWSLAP